MSSCLDDGILSQSCCSMRCRPDYSDELRQKEQKTVSFESGGIENPNMNNHVLDILDGTYNAFTNSSDKYSIVNRR